MNKFVFATGIAVTTAVSLTAYFLLRTTPKAESVKEVTTQIVEQKATTETKTFKKKIKRVSLRPDNTLFLFEEVLPQNSNVLALTITTLDNGSSDPLYLLIDSPGGSVFAGAKVISAIEGSTRPVYTVCVGLCASMGAMIHSYGHKRLATDRSVLMYHPASGGFQGPLPRAKSLMGTVERYVNKMEINISRRSGMSSYDYEQHVLRDFWIDAEDSKQLNLVDDLVILDISTLTVPVAEIYLKRPNNFNNYNLPGTDVWMKY